MRFANYGRKSIFSDKSDSVDNQFRMAREYAECHFSGQIDSFTQYSDEDFTGANTNRPDLQRLIRDIGCGLIDVLIVYQLDRLSRDVRDFANIYAILEEHHVNFVSLKENIDTTTPIGRAMMYVTIVFAQMERETIAARVSDNMLGLAKKGYWTGGNPPYGYVRKQIIVDGRKHVTIVPDPEGVKYVTDIFDLYIQLGLSLQGMETYFKNNGIRTRSGAFFSTYQIYKILTMPFCVEATPEVYDYYASKGCIMDPDSPRNKWDGSHGVLIYGRTTEKNKKHQLNPTEKWIVCLGLHQPFMPAEKWLSVQSRMSKNKFDKTMKYDVPLLKGVLRCRCGSIMHVSRKTKKSGEVSSWYYCLKRMRQGESACPGSHSIKTCILDQKVLDILRNIEADPALIRDYISVPVSSVTDISSINKRIASLETKLGNLASSLALSENSSASKYIIQEIEKLDSELHDLKQEQLTASMLIQKEQESIRTAEARADDICRLIRNFDTFSPKERNDIIKSVISSCVWDGETLSVCI